MTQDQMDQAIAEDKMHSLGFRGGEWKEPWSRRSKHLHLLIVRMAQPPLWGAVRLPADYDKHQQAHADGWNNITRFDDPVTAAVYLLSLGDL